MSADRADPTSVDDAFGRQLLKHTEALAHLRQQVEQLNGETTGTLANVLVRLEAVEGAAEAASDRTVSSWSWQHLDPDAAETLTTELGQWVDWVRQRYPLARRIPPCWGDHPEIVEELTALWLAWQAAYAEPDSPLTAAADWHDRWLPGVLHRLEHGPFALDCADHHNPRPSSAYARPLPVESSGADTNGSESP